MNDFFQVFGLPRNPFLNVAELKARFIERSAQCHPDRFHQAAENERQAAHRQYTELNSAYQCLRDTRQRIAHLLELERGRRPGVVEQVPGDLMERFMEIGGIAQAVDRFAAEMEQTDSPLLKAGLWTRGIELTDEINRTLGSLNQLREPAEEELRSLGDRWPADGTPDRELMERLENAYRTLSHLERWTQQLNERNGRLAALMTA